MKVCVTIIIEKDTIYERFLEFYETFKKTNGDFSVCIVNNSKNNLIKIENEKYFNYLNIIQNNIDVGFVTAVNQGLHYSMSSGFDYTVSINSSNAIVADGNWLIKSISDFGQKYGIGGTQVPVKINSSERLKRILYSIDPSGDINWLSKWFNRYMVTSFIDSNIFIINNRLLSRVKMPESSVCDLSSYGLFLSISFMKEDIGIINLRSIYSSQNDVYRFDIFDVVNKGVGILSPVSIDSVRKRFEN